MARNGKAAKPMSATVLGSRIRQARKDSRLSQSQLASRIGAHFTSVSDWERGRNVPSTRHLVSIARETGQAVEFFLGEQDEEEESDPVSDLMAALRRLVREELKTAEPTASLGRATVGSDFTGG